MSEQTWGGAASRDDFRNRVEVEYTDALTGEQRIAAAAHEESYVALGHIWRTMQVREAPGSVINTPELAQRLADACLADLCFH